MIFKMRRTLSIVCSVLLAIMMLLGSLSIMATQVMAATGLTGATITGTAQVGSVLTAGVTPAGATATYQWQESATAGGTYTSISGATGSTYTPVTGDATKYIEVVATGSGSYTGTVTSAAAGPVAAATTALTGATTTVTTTTSPVVLPIPAAFVASSLSINQTTVKTGENVSISLRLTNIGNVTGTDIVELEINNQIIGSQNVTIAGGLSTVVIFSASAKSSGNFLVQVAGLNGNFTVTKNTNPLWFWLGTDIVLAVIIISGVVLIRNRKT